MIFSGDIPECKDIMALLWTKANPTSQVTQKTVHPMTNKRRTILFSMLSDDFYFSKTEYRSISFYLPRRSFYSRKLIVFRMFRHIVTRKKSN